MRSRRVRLAVAGLALAVVGAGCAGFQLNKVVENSDSEGPFTVHVVCTVGAGPTTFDDDIIFDDFTNGESTAPEEYGFLTDEEETITCVFTETDPAGAADWEFDCSVVFGDAVCTPNGQTMTVTVPADEDTENEPNFNAILVEIVNTFADPATPPTTAPANTAAEAVTAQPTTTG
jgi:hypothetical protein